ncbi:MAG: hypothetical protein ACE5J7_00030 [Candidatus Aenigmatarchaeota archaeon]
MDTMCKANVLNVKGSRAIVDINGTRKAVSVREGVKIRKGDTVLIAFGSIIDKLR